ncbi:C6 zinc finger domain protein [Colletotrichum karsti]|uniref:C6 zinc finger domain protein n=1 Tax=Colletotrichum karsti TaxID=1095194 RepID=A0A9P6HX60_9PEZI|nr:C6 zinc finger domain protein [Colletotrichum karsti]KAF9871745.1 C6 zinc finger domain protein [Colletotrichum karsti]
MATSRRLALHVVSETAPPSTGRRQCWECQRRRVVCDSVRPVCGKCKATGVVCPGYEDKKPLTWLAPGKVKTRTWKRKKPAEKKVLPSDSSKEVAGADSMVLARTSNQLMHVFPGFEFRTETDDIVEATLYWNESVLPSFQNAQLTSSPWVVPAQYVCYMPKATLHALVSMAIEHRMIRLARKKTDPYMVEIGARFHQHRQTAIEALKKDLSNEKIRTSRQTIASVLVFMYADLMGASTASSWHHHMNGLKSLVDMIGGLEAAYRNDPFIHPLLLFPKILETFANSTSPADNLLGPLDTYNSIETVGVLFETGYYPCLPCPVDLFCDIIRINRLRHLIATNTLTEDIGTSQSLAEDLLERIIEFSPEAWSETRKDSKKEFLLMGQAYQSAVTVYAISSLQGLKALPSSAGWRAVRTIHYGRLIKLLETASKDYLMKNCVLWPLIVAGFEASTGSVDMRTFVVDQLVAMSRDLGVCTMLRAVEVLERFWASGKSTWDECFDSPTIVVV